MATITLRSFAVLPTAQDDTVYVERSKGGLFIELLKSPPSLTSEHIRY
jgi:hypothetical protein